MIAFAADREAAVFVTDCVDMATDAVSAEYEGHMFAVMARVHSDPEKRKHQYKYMMQMLQGHFGPRVHEEFQIYFDESLTLN